MNKEEEEASKGILQNKLRLVIGTNRKYRNMVLAELKSAQGNKAYIIQEGNNNWAGEGFFS